MPAVKLTGADEVVQRFKALGADIEASLSATSQTLAAGLQVEVQQDLLSGQILGRLFGGLAPSLSATVEVDGGVVTAEILLADPAPDAALLASGGVSSGPVSPEALSFGPQSQSVFTKVAHLPDPTPSAAAHLQTSLHDMAAEITTELQQAVARALKGQGQ